MWSRGDNDYGREWFLFLWSFGTGPVHAARSSSQTGARTNPDSSQAGNSNSPAGIESGRCAAADHSSGERKYIRQHGISEHNASALVLRGKDLESLADDPEELGADLQALAGPSAGRAAVPSLSMDSAVANFRLKTPSAKSESIRIHFRLNTTSSAIAELRSSRNQARINSMGTGYYNFGDDVWNSRNPYAAQKAPFLLKEYGGSLEGSVSKVASFFLTVDRAAIDNGAIINGTTLDPNTPRYQSIYAGIPDSPTQDSSESARRLPTDADRHSFDPLCLLYCGTLSIPGFAASIWLPPVFTITATIRLSRSPLHSTMSRVRL